MKITHSVSLSKHTSFRTGGNARFFVAVDSLDELKIVLARARSENLPYMILGEGTNVLASDEDFPGYVIRPMIRGVDFSDGIHIGINSDMSRGGIRGNEGEDGLVIAGAGEHWDDVVARTVSKNLSGLENLSSIPGSVGAAPVQNVGAYGVELKDVLEWVEVFDPKENATKILSCSDCRFGYRDSFFKSPAGRDLIIIRVAMKLIPNGRPNISYKDLANYFSADEGSPMKKSPTIAEVRKAVIQIRRVKLPDIKEYGTAGSFFKNLVVTDSKYEELAGKFPGLPSFPVEPVDSTALTAHGSKNGFKKIPLAWILDKVCKLNGTREGDVGVCETQPLALVNYGQATSAEVKNFAEKISDIVKEKTGLQIEWEVNLI